MIQEVLCKARYLLCWLCPSLTPQLCQQVIQEVLCWSRNPMEVRRLCARKEEIYAKLIGNHKPPVVPGVPVFLDTLVKHNVSPFTSLPSMQDACPIWLLLVTMRYADVPCLLCALKRDVWHLASPPFISETSCNM